MSKHSRTWRGLVFIATSLDGRIARQDHDLRWLTDPPSGRVHAPVLKTPTSPAPPTYEEFMDTVSHIVMGRGTYDKVMTFDSWPYASKTVFVLSSSKRYDDPNVTVFDSTSAVVSALSQDHAGGVYVDGGLVIQEFLREGLIDEMTINTAPVLLGDGIPLFGSLRDDILLTHLGTSYGSNGMVATSYAVS